MAARRSRAGYDGKIAGLYDLEDTIGRGHFAVVKLARHVFTGEKVAVKVIDKTKLDEVSRSHLFQEVRCMKLVQHPNVVRLYEVIDTQTKLYLILELGDGGDMYDYIMRHTGGLDEKVAKRYFRQIVEAISYCHKLHVVHRDLKPENVVFFEKLGLVKLTDFGFSNMFAPGKKLETSCGSLAYSAPEILLGDSYDAPAVDVWSLGVILFMLVVGEAPFQEANDSETLTMIMDCRYHVPHTISDKCKDLIGKMLQREPVRRASLSSIMAHPWLNDGDLTPMSSFLPLITKEMISEDDQGYVVQKMVEGKIASREEILSSIEKNSYDHITATYYLLIERRLRKHQQHEHMQLQQQPSSGSLRKQSAPSPSRSAKPHLEPLMLSPRTPPPYETVRWNGIFSLPPPVTVTDVEDEFSKQKELKKTKTAPIPPARPSFASLGGMSPSILVSPPVEELTTSPGPYFVKSLTTSMTLDRRKNSKKQQPQTPPLLGSVSPKTTQRKLSSPGETRKVSVSSPQGNEPPNWTLKNTTVMSRSDPGASSKKPTPTPVSKIALLSSFFERKAKQEAMSEKDPKFNLGWFRGNRRQPNLIHQRIMEKLETPCSPSAMAVDPEGQSQGMQGGTGAENPGDAGTSHYVQSLVSPPGTHPSTSASTSQQLQTTPSPTESHLLAPPGPGVPALRKCSLIKEESLDEYDDEDDDDCDMATIKPVKSLESLDDIGTNSHVALSTSATNLSSPTSSVTDVNPRRSLKSVCSSPQLLNQIHEENESEDEDSFVPLKMTQPRRFGGGSSAGSHREASSASPEILRKFEQRKKRRGAGQRGTSCSSSDASDTDDTEGRSRKDKLRHKFIHRRDSSDHSSDTDGPGGNLGGNGRLGGGGGAARGSRTHNGGGGSGGGGGGGGGGGSGGGGGGGGSGGNKGGGGGGGGGGSHEKKSSDRNQNNKNCTNNHKNSRYHSGGGGGGGSKGSLTDSSLKLLSRKLSDISSGVGALLSDCRGSDCDNDSPLHQPHSPSTLLRHHSSSLRSNSSLHSGLHSDSTLYPVSERGVTASPKSPTVQYFGQTVDTDSICGYPQSVEFSEISNCLAVDSDSQCSQSEPRAQGCGKTLDGGVGVGKGGPRRSVEVSGGSLHCKPVSKSVSVVPVKSKCCSVV